jgi:hypothetical protein
LQAERAAEQELRPTHRIALATENPAGFSKGKGSVEVAHTSCFPEDRSRMKKRSGRANGEYVAQKGILNDCHTPKYRHREREGFASSI